MNGIQLIQAERKRQRREKGWTLAHDREHQGDELALAAVTYALPAKHRAMVIWTTTLKDLVWPKGWDFRGNPDRIRELTKAGALIAAEIDRLITEPENASKENGHG